MNRHHEPEAGYELEVIRSLDEIPTHFDSEDQEREFWSTHELSDELADALEEVEPDKLDELLSLPPRQLITSLKEVPEFEDELQAFRWWQAHEVSDDLYFSLEEGSPDYERIAPYAERRQRAERGKRAGKVKRKAS